MISIIFQLIYKAAPLALILIANQKLDSKDFGIFIFATTLQGVLGAIVIFATTITFLAEYRINEYSAKYSAALIKMRFCLSMAVLVVFIVIDELVFNLDAVVKYSVLLIILSSIFDAEFYILARNKFKEYLMMSVIYLLSLLIVVFQGNIEWGGYLLMASFGYSASNVFAFFRLEKRLRLLDVINSDNAICVTVFKKSYHVFLSTYQVMLVSKVYSLFLGFVGNLTLLGAYGMIEKMSDVFRIFLQVIHKFYLSKNVVDITNAARFRSNSWGLLISGGVALLFFPLLIYLLYYIDFFDLIQIWFWVPVFLILMVHHFNNCIGLNYLMLIGKSASVFYSNLIGFFVAAILLLIGFGLDVEHRYLVYCLLAAEISVLLVRIFFIHRGNN